MQHLASAQPRAEPAFNASLASDAEAAGAYLAEMEAALHRLGPSAERDGERRGEAQAIKDSSRAVKERFFRRHAIAMYDEMTSRPRAACACPNCLPRRRAAIRPSCRRPR